MLGETVGFSVGAVQRHIPCPHVGSPVVVLWSVVGRSARVIGCLSAGVCGCRAEEPEARRSFGCPIPERPIGPTPGLDARE